MLGAKRFVSAQSSELVTSTTYLYFRGYEFVQIIENQDRRSVKHCLFCGKGELCLHMANRLLHESGKVDGVNI